MGKLKFTFANLWFWVAMIVAVFLTENLMHLTDNPKAGFDYPTLIILSLACIVCLFMFFFIHHKRNKMKIDWVLLPSFIIFGALLIVGVWINKGESFAYSDGSGTIDVVITIHDKIKSTIILCVFLLFSYGMFFSVQANAPHSRRGQFLAYVGIFAALISLVFSLATEYKIYIAIFKGEILPNMSIDSFYGNKNYYGGVLLIGFLACIIANYHKPRLVNFLFMIIFALAILASAAMLPALVASGALVIYLFEEVIRFSVKKKWLYSFYSTLSILIVLSLVLIFYYGVTHYWDGFRGLDVYITDMFAKKNFATLTGRIYIWNAILPHVADSATHLVFGHGFMISEKLILGITGAMNNNPLSGVRTTHNGYLQIAFEYGLVGMIIHGVLISYFIYSCIRLMLEKRFHMAFVYLFVGLCAGVYNFCESSSYFDSGVKEIYMTALFAMPAIREAKLIKYQNKVEEAKKIDVGSNPLNHIALGRSLAVILMSLICGCGVMFMCSYTYQMGWLKTILLNTIIGLGIAFIFVPYLISLYYKNSDKFYFVLRLAFNALIFAFLIASMFILMNKVDGLKAYIPYAFPGMIFLVLLLEVVTYSIIKNGNIKEWASVTLIGGFMINKFAIGASLLTGLVCFLLYENLNYLNMFSYLVIPAFAMIMFYVVLYFFPSKKGKETMKSVNDNGLLAIKREAIFGETYYG